MTIGLPEIQILAGLITVLLSGGLLIAATGYRKQRKQEPIDMETAAVINARTAGDMALAIAKQQESSMLVLREDLKVLRSEHTNTREELRDLRKSFLSIISWLRDLFDNWDEHRLSDDPPKLPPGVYLWKD